MRSKAGMTAVLLALLGLSLPASGQFYENDLGAGFGDEGLYEDSRYGFGEDNEFGFGEEEYGFGEDEYGFGEDEGFLGDEGLYGGETEWGTDEYGYYDQNYDWQTDDEWFDGWFGESDEDWI